MQRVAIVMLLCLYGQLIWGQGSIYDKINKARSISDETSEQIEALKVLLEDSSILSYSDTLGLIHHAIAFRYSLLEEHELVISHCQAGLEFFQKENYNDYQKSALLSLLGDAYYYLGKDILSIEAYQKISQLQPKGRDFEVYGSAYNQLARLFNGYEDFDLAKSITEQIISSNYIESIPLVDYLGILLSGSIAYSSFEDEKSLERAAELLTRSQSLYRKNNVEHDIATSLSMQSAYLSIKNNRPLKGGKTYEGLLEDLSQKEQSELNNEAMADLASNASYAYQEIGAFEKSLNMARRAHNIFTLYGIEEYIQSEYLIYDNLACAFLGLRQLDSAFYYIEKGLGLFPKKEVHQRNRGFVLNLMYDKARIQSAKGSEDARYYNEALSNLQELDKLFELHIQDQLSEYSVANLKNKGLKYYHQAIEISAKLNDQEAFWHFSEKTKGLLLLRAHVARRQYDNMNVSQRLLDSLKTKKLELRHELSIVDPDSNTANTLINGLATIRQKIIGYTIALQGTSKEFPDPVNLNSIQNILNQNQQILQYQFTSDSLWLQLVNKSTVQIYNLGSARVINNEVRTLRSLLQNQQSSIEELNITSNSLYQQLIGPINPRGSELIIIPDQKLHFLPFEILKPLNDDKPLIAAHSMFYLPSGTFMTLETEINTTGDISLFAPIYSHSESPLKSLPYASDEVSWIHSLFKGSSVYKKNVDKAELIRLMGKSSVIHFSGHAIANPEANLNYLALNSGASWEDRLGIDEILSLSTQANFVTLSACDTGTGELMNGEGVSSLSRAFLYSGAQSVVSTLWKVDDLSTSKILVSFYSKLKNGTSKARALQEAKIEYLKSAESYEKHPYYWAGIIGTGLMHQPLFQAPNWSERFIYFLIVLGLLTFLLYLYRSKVAPKL